MFYSKKWWYTRRFEKNNTLHLKCHFWKSLNRQNFWCCRGAKIKTRRLVPFLARLAHGYPQGWFSKFLLKFLMRTVRLFSSLCCTVDLELLYVGWNQKAVSRDGISHCSFVLYWMLNSKCWFWNRWNIFVKEAVNKIIYKERDMF